MDAAIAISPDSSRRRLIGRLIVLAFTVACAPLMAQTAPSTQPIGNLSPLVAKLDDPNAESRDSAAEQLMSLQSTDLPDLRKAVSDAQPISTNQAVQLQRVVEHVYLAALDYPKDPDHSPFLGLYWPQNDGNIALAGGPIRVICRLPGFDSNRMLRDGDTIISVGEKVVASSTQNQFIQLIHGYQPGQLVNLTVERHGKVTEVLCRLSTRPAYFDNRDSEAVTGWIDQRLKQADSYWLTNFASLVKLPPM